MGVGHRRNGSRLQMLDWPEKCSERTRNAARNVGTLQEKKNTKERQRAGDGAHIYECSKYFVLSQTELDNFQYCMGELTSCQENYSSHISLFFFKLAQVCT